MSMVIEMSDTSVNGSLTIILADSEIELVPKEFWSHPAVVQNAKKRKKRPSRVLLESTLHYSIFKDRDERKRRGRPDIVHQFLLMGLDSILNSVGELHLYVHTRNDELITVDPATRLPKNYNRYAGLFEELFKTGSVPAGKDPLITIEDKVDLSTIIGRIQGNGPVVLFHPDGERKETNALFREFKDGKDVICIIGGFSHGDFTSPVKELSDLQISLPGGELKVWTVISEILVGFRQS